MKYSEVGFRAVYHSFIVIKNDENALRAVTGFPGADKANSVLAYGYYDRDAGITLEALASAYVGKDGKGFKYLKGPDDSSSKIRIEAVENAEFDVCTDDDGSLAETFSEKLAMLKVYDAPEDVEMSRKMTFLDYCRDPYFIDDVLVRLMKDELSPEGCWVRITNLVDNYFMGILLNEPCQDFRWHKGESIAFFVGKTDEGEVYCYSDMNPSAKITEEDLADGTMLKGAVKVFNGERNMPNFLNVLEILRDSWVWVPCKAKMSDADEARFAAMVEAHMDDLDGMKGEEFQNHDPIRFIPDILQNGEEFFFPIFSSEEEMGEYGEEFSAVQKHMMEVMPLAKNNDRKPSGIVLNAFTDPFVLEAKIYDVFEGMKSRLPEETWYKNAMETEDAKKDG